MSYDYTRNELTHGSEEISNKRDYFKPQLIRYGAVRDLTQAGGSGLAEGDPESCGNPGANEAC